MMTLYKDLFLMATQSKRIQFGQVAELNGRRWTRWHTQIQFTLKGNNYPLASTAGLLTVFDPGCFEVEPHEHDIIPIFQTDGPTQGISNKYLAITYLTQSMPDYWRRTVVTRVNRTSV